MSAERSARSIRQTSGLDPVRALQWVLYRCAKSDPARRFHALYGHVARSDVLWQAWADVCANAGAPGVDGVSVHAVEAAGVQSFLRRARRGPSGREVSACLRCGGCTFPSPVNRATPPLGDSSVRDRVAMAAAKSLTEPVFEADFLPGATGSAAP